MTKPSRRPSADGKRPQSGVDAAAANLVDGATGSRPTAAAGGGPDGPAYVSDMSDSSGGESPLCNLMEVKH